MSYFGELETLRMSGTASCCFGELDRPALPECVGRFSHLEHLEARECELKDVSCSWNLSLLRTLDVRENRLSALPLVGGRVRGGPRVSIHTAPPPLGAVFVVT